MKMVPSLKTKIAEWFIILALSTVLFVNFSGQSLVDFANDNKYALIFKKSE